eukprot:TRINITY_DN6355_c0_g1_i1.p1 TRINITY_DN6355_c0_g1~~TRINITY_DN6355_c0_g1_i1.p1  ORF type:complete len:351 (-),score=81.50 TRINITY_DN6355_c0_g1_i1:67-1119(-)
MCIRDRSMKPVGLVTAHIYDVGTRSSVRKFNLITESLFHSGAYHAGIEVYGREWSFQKTDTGTGLFPCEPKHNSSHTYKESIELGVTPLDENHVWLVLKELKDIWLGTTYDLIRRNCCHFCNVFCEKLEVNLLPDNILKLANKAERMKDRADHIREKAHNLKEKAHEKAHRVKERFSHLGGSVEIEDPVTGKRSRSTSAPHKLSETTTDPVLRIWKSLSPKPNDFQLINLDRYLLKEGHLNFLETDNGQVFEYVVCLFNDVLLICAPKGEKLQLKYVAEFAGRIGVAVEDELTGYSSQRPVVSTSGVEFRLRTPKKSLIFFAATKEEKESWVSLMRDVIYTMLHKSAARN